MLFLVIFMLLAIALPHLQKNTNLYTKMKSSKRFSGFVLVEQQRNEIKFDRLRVRVCPLHLFRDHELILHKSNKILTS